MRDAQHAQPCSLREQERLALGTCRGDRLRKLREPALHRFHGRAQRETLERVRQRGLANLCATQQRLHGMAAADRKDHQTPDPTVGHVRPDEMEALTELLGQHFAQRVDNPLVVRVEDQRDRAQPQEAELRVVEVDDLRRQRQQPPEWLQIPRQDQRLVPKAVLAAAQRLDRCRQPLQLGPYRAGVQWAPNWEFLRGVVGSGVARDLRQ